MDNKAQMVLTSLSAWATLLICFMTFVTFMYTTGTWERPTYESSFEEASILGYGGTWGENIVVTYTDGTTETMKGISNNFWRKMAVQNDGSNPIVSVEYTLDVKIPVSDTFSTQNYLCDIFVTQNYSNVAYHGSFSMPSSVDIPANVWTRVITVPLNFNGISDGAYVVSFENTGTIAGVTVPTGLSLDVSITDGVVTFML